MKVATFNIPPYEKIKEECRGKLFGFIIKFSILTTILIMTQSERSIYLRNFEIAEINSKFNSLDFKLTLKRWVFSVLLRGVFYNTQKVQILTY